MKNQAKKSACLIASLNNKPNGWSRQFAIL